MRAGGHWREEETHGASPSSQSQSRLTRPPNTSSQPYHRPTTCCCILVCIMSGDLKNHLVKTSDVHGWLGSETYTVDQQLWVELSKACGEYVETLVAPQIKLCVWRAWWVGHHRLWLQAGVWNTDESGAHLMKLFSVVKWGKLPS